MFMITKQKSYSLNKLDITYGSLSIMAAEPLRPGWSPRKIEEEHYRNFTKAQRRLNHGAMLRSKHNMFHFIMFQESQFREQTT